MDQLVPIFICAVMPVAIVFIIFWTTRNNDNRRAEVLIKAIEANNNIDADKLAEALGKPRKTAREILNARLLRGCIYTLVGIALVILGLVTSYDKPYVFSPNLVFIIGGISLAIGVSYLVVYFVTRNQTDDNK